MDYSHVSRSPGMTVLSARRDAPPGPAGRATARLPACPGIVMATAAPIGLVALLVLPTVRPPDLLACLFSLSAVIVLVAAARVASTDRRERHGRFGRRLPPGNGTGSRLKQSGPGRAPASGAVRPCHCQHRPRDRPGTGGGRGQRRVRGGWPGPGRWLAGLGCFCRPGRPRPRRFGRRRRGRLRPAPDGTG